MDRGAVVTALDADHFAHFVEAGAEADSDAVGERLFPGKVRVIEVVGGEEGHTAVIVPSIDDLGHRIADPVGRFGGAEFIEDEDIGLVDRFKYTEFGRLGDVVVAVLNLLEEITEIIEEAANALLEKGIESGDGEMGLPDAAGTHQEEPDIEDRVLPNQLLRVGEGV